MQLRMTSTCNGASTIEFEGSAEAFIQANGGADVELLKANLDGRTAEEFFEELKTYGKVHICGCVGLCYEIEEVKE